MSGARILVLNAGSSSLKGSVVDLGRGTTVAESDVDWGADATRADDRERSVLDALAALGVGPDGTAPEPVVAAGHRVVHGGARLTRATLIDDDVIEAIRAVSELAPLHNEVARATIEAARRALPGIAHVACFDTAFHATLPPEATRYPVSEAWSRDWGVRRYGFHGLSVAWSVRRAGELLRRDPTGLGIIVAHLGSGCSVTAVEGGRSVDTSMGMTPLEGLMMGTRSGSIDPGIITRLIVDGRLDAVAIAEALDHASGLLGVSGRSSDVRELLAAEADGDGRAALALAMFVRRAAAGIASAATALRRLDAVVFTGGIGANSDPIRRGIVGRLGSIGIRALPDATAGPGDGLIGDTDGRVAVLRIEAREDLVIAEETAEVAGIRAGSGRPARGYHREDAAALS